MGKASRAKRQRREKLTAAHRSQLQRLPQRPGDEPYQIVNLRGGRKMSEMLIELADPWLQEARTDTELKGLIDVAATAWNLALIPEPERWSQISPEMAREMGQYGLSLLRQMVARRLELFPDNDRPILKYETIGKNRKYRVNVQYEVSPEEVDLAGPAQTEPDPE